MDDLSLAVEAARAGAEVVRDRFGHTSRTSLKALHNPVTDVDEEAEREVLAVLRSARPGDDILAEESGGGTGTGRRWIVDPLDGTVNFIHSIPQIAVSVALYEGPEALVAAIIDPLRNEEFAALRGAGAALNGSPLSVSSTTELADAVVATGFPYDHHRYAAEYAHTLATVLREVNGIRRAGSAALDLAWVAAGRYDAYWELGLAPWDLAAGLLLVREAGGTATDPMGIPSAPERPLVVASNGVLHERVRGLVAATLPAHLR